MRDALSLTDQAIAFGAGQLKGPDVRQMLGSVDRTHVFELLDALAAHDGARLVQLIQDLRSAGHSAGMALEEMARVLQRAAVLMHAPQTHSDDPDAERMARLKSAYAPPECR